MSTLLLSRQHRREQENFAGLNKLSGINFDHATIGMALGISTFPSASAVPRHFDLSLLSFETPSSAAQCVAPFAQPAWLDLLQEAIALVDFDGNVCEWNRAMAQLSGIARGEALGCKLFALLPADFEKNLAAHLLLAFLHGQSSDGEFSQRHAENEIFSFQYRIAKIDWEPSRERVMVSLIDKSDRDRLQRQLRKQEQFSTLGKLSSGIAYELAAPLDAICSAIDKMLGAAEETANGEIESGLHGILGEVYRIGHLTDNIIALAHSEAPSLMQVNVHALVLEAVALLEHHLNRRPVCNLRLHPNLTTVEGDPILLRCVLHNVLKNAVEAAGDDAVPLLEASGDQQSSVVIRIEDRGAESAAITAQQVFERSPATRNFEVGSELGMFLSKKIVEAHKGEIKAEGQIGRGTVYTIILPTQAEVTAAGANVR